jgi:ribosome maturation factor RimP
MGSPAEIKASFSQISSCWLTKLMNILQKAINSLLLRIIALVFSDRARQWKVSVFSRKEQSSK